MAGASSCWIASTRADSRREASMRRSSAGLRRSCRQQAAYIDGKVASSRPTRDRLIIVASHHPSAEMNNPFPDPDTAGERFRGPQLEELLHRFPNVVLHIAGHSTRAPRCRRSRVPSAPPPATGRSPHPRPRTIRCRDACWRSQTTATAPSRFSAPSTTAPPPIVPGDAGDPTPDDGVNQLLLAGVARQAAVGDPQLDLEAAGLAPSDRNVELLLPAPFAMPRRRPTRKPKAVRCTGDQWVLPSK